MGRRRGSGSGRGHSTSAQLFDRGSVGIGFDHSDITAGLNELAAKLSDAMLSGAAAGARVLYDEIHANVPEQSGRLKASIYRTYIKQRSDEKRQIYAIGVNKRTAKHWHLIEYGHWRVNRLVQLKSGEWVPTKERLAQPVWVPAEPYLRPAYDAKIGAALDATRDRMRQKLQEG